MGAERSSYLPCLALFSTAMNSLCTRQWEGGWEHSSFHFLESPESHCYHLNSQSNTFRENHSFLFVLWVHSIFLWSTLSCHCNRSESKAVEGVRLLASVYCNSSFTDEDTWSPGIYIISSKVETLHKIHLSPKTKTFSSASLTQLFIFLIMTTIPPNPNPLSPKSF